MSVKPHQPASWASYTRLLNYARPYAWRLAAGIGCGIMFAGSMGGLLFAVRNLLRNVFDPENMAGFALAVAALPVLALVRGLGQFVSDYYMEWVGHRVVMDLRLAVFSHLQRLSIGYYSKSKTGELISRAINDTMIVERAVSTVLGTLVKEPFALVAAVIFVFWLDPLLSAVSLVLFPLCLVPISLFGRKVRRHGRECQERLAGLVAIMQEAVSGIRVVKAFGMEDRERGRFAAECERFFRRAVKVVRAKASVEPVIVFISAIGLVLVLFYARWAKTPPEDFITFAIAMFSMYEPVKKISKIHLSIQQATAGSDRVFEVLDTPVKVGDMPGAVEFDEPVQTISFEKVCFAYDDELVLKDLNFTVETGRHTAIVGSSGAGKSTLINLIPRFYDVTSGRIALNGKDIRDFTLGSLRRQLGLVTQDVFLFDDTVAGNIAYGCRDADRSHIEEAARRANAHDFIMALPRGYETVVRERGVRLSGGQCQRLAIARAILRNPPILLLDEATSSLDTESERLVQSAIEELMRGRTVFVIAHRLSTILGCDTIIVLDRGRIAEAGAHSELMARNGIYKRLYDMQFSDSRRGGAGA